MYKIIGADGKEYGPVSAELLRQWLNEGRLNQQSRVQVEGSTEWTTLGSISEFAPAAIPPAFAFQSSAGINPEVLDSDYDLEIGVCISKGSTLLQANLGVLIGAIIIYFGIEIVLGALSAIPIIGTLFSLLNLLIAPPLMGGLFYITLQAIRNQPTSAGDVFEGFRRAFIQLCLGSIVPAIFTALCFIPAGVVAALIIVPAHGNHSQPELGAILTIAGAGLICLIPAMILSVNWMFTLPLIVDKGLDFWTAMKTSWRQVTKHWWNIFALLLLVGVINVGGLILCCVGLIFTMPLGIAATMYAYEAIFSNTRT